MEIVTMFFLALFLAFLAAAGVVTARAAASSPVRHALPRTHYGT